MKAKIFYLRSKSIVQQNNFGFYKLFIASLFTLFIFYLITPPIVSFDGNLYLASGKSFFSIEQMAQYYHWAREPLYPLMIYTAIKFGSLKFLFIFQMVITSIGISIIIYRWAKFSRVSWRMSYQYSAVVISASLVHGYTTSVLQVSLFILLVGLLVDFVSKLNSEELISSKKYWSGIFLSIFVSVLSLNAILTYSVLMLIMISVVRHKFQLFKIFLLSVVVMLSVTTSWTYVKDSINTGQSFFKGVETPRESIKLFLNPAELNESLERIQQAPLSLLGLAPDRFLGLSFQQLSFEARIYGLPITENPTRCGKVDPSIPPINEYISDVVITDKCVPLRLEKIMNYVNFLLGKSLPIFGAFFYFLIFTISRQSRGQKLQLFVPLSFLLPYILLGAANSRYGAPILIFGVISATQFVLLLGSKKKE